jgi:hypothetical protein
MPWTKMLRWRRLGLAAAVLGLKRTGGQLSICVVANDHAHLESALPGVKMCVAPPLWVCLRREGVVECVSYTKMCSSAIC